VWSYDSSLFWLLLREPHYRANRKPSYQMRAGERYFPKNFPDEVAGGNV
jgi:hypothetical protein